MITKDELKELASQLRKPKGEKGIEIADMMNESNRDMIIHSWNYLDLQDHCRILEIGHGNAGHLSQLLNQAENLTYYGLDISELMHTVAKNHYQEFIHQKKVSFHLYDGVEIPFSEGFFDRIFTVNTLYFWQNPVHFLKELYRVLAPKGKLTITYGTKDFIEKLPFSPFGFQTYSNEEVAQLVGKTPFQIEGFYLKSEYIKSKMGEMVDRDFVTAVLAKF